MQTQSIASLYAELEAQTAHIAALEAAGVGYSGSKDDPLEIADNAWTEKSLTIIKQPAETVADVVLQLKTLVELSEPPNCGTEESVTEAFHKNALRALESH